ncbi:hypothetical protein AB0Y14_12360 [Rothia sp. HC945]
MVAFILAGLLCAMGLACVAIVITHRPWQRLMFSLVVFALGIGVGLLLF